MKHRFTFFLASALVLFSFVTASAQVRFGIKTGLNLANISYSDDYIESSEVAISGSISTGMVPAFHLGGVVEFDFGNHIGLSTGLELNVKGGSLDLDGLLFGEPFTATAKTRPMYLQVPMALHFRNKGFYAGVGPYLAFGIGGKTKVKVESGGETGSDTDAIEFGNNADDAFAPVDYGLRAELGYEFSNFRASASYNLGLANAAPKDGVDEGDAAGLDFNYRHNVIGISVAYFFKGKGE